MPTFALMLLLLLTALHPAFGASGDQREPAAVQATLKEIIRELADNQVTDERYSKDLQAEIKRQLDFIFPTLTAAGSLKFLKFLDSAHPTPSRRVDRFLAEHEDTSFVWTISQDAGGVVTLLVLAPSNVSATPEEKRTALAGATLTEIIGGLRDGKIDKSRWSAALYEELQNQKDIIVPSLVAAGPLLTLKFLNATRSEKGQQINQFLSEHENADFLWTISMDRKDVITLLLMQPAN